MPQTLMSSFISTFLNEDFFVDLTRICIYPASFNITISTERESVLNFFLSFFKSLRNQVNALQIPNSSNVISCINTLQNLFNIRESSTSVLNSQTVFKHIGKEPAVVRMVQKAVSSQITNIDEFRQVVDVVTNTIYYYYELQNVSSTIKDFDQFRDLISQNSIKPFEALKKYKDLVIAAYNDLSKLQSLSKDETIRDYFIVSDEVSCAQLSKQLLKYIVKGFSVFKTGFTLFDSNLEGFESSSVHLISAPSNHGKSLFTVNLCYRIIQNNINDFSPNDCILFVTLEDDIYKLLRRFVSIFGNYSFSSVKKLFITSYDTVKALSFTVNNGSLLTSNGNNGSSDDDSVLDYIEQRYSSFFSNMRELFNKILRSSIAKVTQGKVNLIIKHCNENEFSSADLSRFIDRLKIDGYNVRVVFLDYIDVMSPSYVRFSGAKEYDLQGQIVQELRALSRIHHVPIISPTQSRRESERLTSALTNEMIGDSYKKVRYTDYMYMCKMRPDKSLASADVKSSTIEKKSYDETFDIVEYQQSVSRVDSDVLIPFEVKITKSKDSERDQTKYMMFCKKNLRIYNTIDEYLKDEITLKINSEKLEKDIATFLDASITSLTSDLALGEFQIV